MSTFCPIEHSRTISEQLHTAVLAAQAAGTIIRDGSEKLNVVEQKGVGDLVSEVDRDADRAACDILRAASVLPILSEELNADQTTSSDMWIVDPLDGSSAYLMSAGPHFPAALIALRENGATRLGVVYFPLTDQWFYAEKNCGAWHNGNRLLCGTGDSLADVWVEMNQYGDANLETDYFRNLKERLRSNDGARMVTSTVPHSGVAMRIAIGDSLLAAAIHDNNPASTKQAAWDIAAPQIIMEEAGGVFLNPDGLPSNPFETRPIIVSRTLKLAQEIIALTTEISTAD
ncbi:MAG: inositol monophosphatase family protein [Pirellulales bacterium]